MDWRKWTSMERTKIDWANMARQFDQMAETFGPDHPYHRELDDEGNVLQQWTVGDMAQACREKADADVPPDVRY